MRPTSIVLPALGASIIALASCDDDPVGPSDSLLCTAGNGGITLPDGFCAIVVADLESGAEPAAARHMAITPNGDIFVAINSPGNQNPPFGIIALRDTDGDGDADMQEQFSANLGGSGIAWHDGKLYFGANDRVLRYTLASGSLVPTGNAEVVVSGLPATGDHISKTIVIRDATTMFVNIGSASNSCQVANREVESPGVNPCPELATRAGIWTFDPSGTNQIQASGQRFGMGYRNMVALAINPQNNTLYGLQHGRDALFDDWPDLYDVNDESAIPSEEFLRITNGSDAGWPYCYFDAATENKRVLAPEYGGNGTLVSAGGINCAGRNEPIANYEAHWAPNGLHFYRGTQFPSRYRNGAFIAFHGGHDRTPLPNEGFNVVFQPMGANGLPSGAAEIFADGFAGSGTPLPGAAAHRPVGVAEGPDGSLYISDDRGGRIWRIIYRD